MFRMGLQPPPCSMSPPLLPPACCGVVVDDFRGDGLFMMLFYYCLPLSIVERLISSYH